MGKISRILRVFTFVFGLFFVGNALAAGYTCTTKYTSCNPDYYISNCGTYRDGRTIASSALTSGNSCVSCPSGYECDGGLKCPSMAALSVTCSAGKYIANGEKKCEAVCTPGNYCPAGTFTIPASGAVGNTNLNGCPLGYTSDSGNGSKNTCYRNVTRDCTQVDDSVPENCHSVTAWNACSCTGATYKQYYDGTTSGETSNETCYKTPNTVTAKKGAYVSGASCVVCGADKYQTTNGYTGTSCPSSCGTGYSTSGSALTDHDSSSDCTCDTLCSAKRNYYEQKECDTPKTCTVAGGTCYYEGSYQQCNGYYTEGCYSAGSSNCSGCD
ncbi:MAG: hypothetical protein J6S06_02290, partial [Alphaproteobacteria bacterium]|nr:hypothetical protein [Alphaproteobacteria bacterium]